MTTIGSGESVHYQSSGRLTLVQKSKNSATLQEESWSLKRQVVLSPKNNTVRLGRNVVSPRNHKVSPQFQAQSLGRSKLPVLITYSVTRPLKSLPSETQASLVIHLHGGISTWVGIIRGPSGLVKNGLVFLMETGNKLYSKNGRSSKVGSKPTIRSRSKIGC